MTPISLQDIPLLQSLTPEDLQKIGQAMQLKILSGGEILFKEHEVGDCFYIIVLGEFTVIKAIGTPEERFLSTVKQGDFIGELCLMAKDNLRTASVRAVGETHVLELHRNRFEEMVEICPNVAYHMMQILSERLRASDESIINDLRKKNTELDRAYKDLKAAQAELIEKEKLDHELSMARDIQMSILPQKVHLPKGCEVGARMVPARVVGGDFYDFIPLDETRVGIAIGDVSDKGIPAAMFMAQFCTLLRVEAMRNQSPEAVLTKINNYLLEANLAELFVTCIYGIFDTNEHSFSYARAGHEIPVVFDLDGNVSNPAHRKGAALCLFPDPPIDVQTVMIPPGSTLMMYTDGGTDAVNNDGEFLGLEFLKQTILHYLNHSAQDLCDQTIEELLSFKQKAQFDDTTLVALRIL